MNIKYLKHSSLLTSSSFSAVASFATVVNNNALKVQLGEMSIQQFNDGVYLDVPIDLSKEEVLERNSINYIKKSLIDGGAS